MTNFKAIDLLQEAALWEWFPLVGMPLQVHLGQMAGCACYYLWNRRYSGQADPIASHLLF